ncbi:4Fe-4S dicluster domain-containing protein [Spirosoma sp. KNUC1025]|uniref:4Fe-4S dicluster domain-containing protein n=1 Tax=Spirosoma sp. KNUC1025 TaxID=2894082 RepID=UPI0038644155|nr:4Fe-4S binding protein [Spirosoma sp. KNUC1025]
MTYFKDIQTGIRTTLKGLRLTLRHLRNATRRRTPEGIASENYFDLQNGLVTLQYPHEQLPIPDNGRYRLRNEIDDCIVCDKCAKVCPVDCITIDAIKATEEVGRASDGSPIRLYAAKFDIDMAKCCYCGLCTVVCPTECLTMDKKFDYSEFELGELTYHFSNLSPEQADEKRSLYEQFLREKEEAKAAQLAAKAAQQAQSVEPVAKPAASPVRPVFKPTAKPVAKTPPAEPANSEGSSIEHPLTDATPQEMHRIAQGE